MNLRKALSLLLVCIMLATMLPMQAFADLSSSRTAKFREGGVLYDAYGKTYHFDRQYYIQVYQYNSDGSRRKIILDNENTSPKRSFLIAQGGESYRGYCIEHGVYTDETLNMKALSQEGSISFYKGLDRAQRKNIQLALLYGWQSGKDITDTKDTLFTQSKWYRKTCDRYNRDDWYIATQMLIWEIQQGYRTSDMDYNYKTVSGSRVHRELCYLSGNPVSIYHYSGFLKGQGAYDIYRFMADAIKAHGSIASGLKGADKTSPKKITLTQEKDDAGEQAAVWSAVIRDNGKYPVGSSLDDSCRAVNIVKGKDKENLEIKAVRSDTGIMQYKISWRGSSAEDRPPEDTVFTIERVFDSGTDAVKNNLLFWHWNSGSGGWPNHCQTIVTGSCNPQYFYISLTAAEAVPEDETERGEPEYFPEFEFPVSKQDKNPGWDGDVHTGMGDASLGATYTLYRNGAAVDSVTLNDNGEQEILRDKPWESADDFNMTESGSYTHTSEDGVHCSVWPLHTEWTGEITYTIREEAPDGRFVNPDSGIRTYTVSYRAYSDNSQRCTGEPVCWSELQYDVKCRSDKTETDIAGELAEAEAENPVMFNEEIYTNDCYRGKITLSKSLEDENVFDDVSLGGGKRKSTDSYWKLYLKAGYESTKYIRFKREADLADGTAVYRATRDTGGTDNDISGMKIGSNGALMILDVPYGEYYMEETAPDDASFVPEKFTVVIGEHGGEYSEDDRYDNRYDYDIRDKKIENKIKIVKTDEETGKTVSLTGGTKFRIRYMGNRLLSDITTSKNYGRLLPNAASINDKTGNNDEFECDENGFIVIPYMLKFGTYRVEEFAVPEGYFIGDAETPVRYYTFTVDRQNVHEDGNFGQMVDCEGNIYEADPTYDSSRWPYETFYQAVNIANRQVKGTISIDKECEIFTGWKKLVSSGIELTQPVYEMTGKSAGAVFGIFAAEDILLADGNDGACIYDADTEEKLVIPVSKSAHEANTDDAVTGLLEKIYNADVYETGTLEHSSGAKLWYMLERQASESNTRRSVYVTPEQNDTDYSYTYEKEDEEFTYRYDVSAGLKYQAGGISITELQIAKTTVSKKGGAAVINSTEPVQHTAGMEIPNESWGQPGGNLLDFSYRKFIYEADGTTGTDWNGNTADFSEGAAKRAVNEAGEYIVTSQTDEETGEISYRVLLENGETAACDANGNFQTALVEIYDVSYTNRPQSEDDYSFAWDGFELWARTEADKAVTEITAQGGAPQISCGTGCSAKTEGSKTVFTATEPKAPVYFMTRDGVKTQMYYFGGRLKADITIPAAAVKTGWQTTVPEIKIRSTDGEGGSSAAAIDWFENLTYDNQQEVFAPAGGITVTAKYNGGSREPVYYTIEIISDRDENSPVEITYSDGYTASLYCGAASSGNGVGVMELAGEYRTNRYPLSRLVEVITTDENGHAQSNELPLGKYIVRELNAASGYVTDEKAYEVELKYENQNTRLVWAFVRAANRACNVEIDISKAFETSYGSGSYSTGEGAVFGIYTAETISAAGRSADENTASSVEKDTLVDTVTSDKNGRGILKTKLPAGRYYVREIKTKQGYTADETPFYFEVGDKQAESDGALKFDYAGLGVSGKAVMKSYGNTVVTIDVRARLPMPCITVDGTTYPLDESSEYDDMTITQNKDKTTVKLLVCDGGEKTVILPETGKTLKIRTEGNTYSYELDGASGTYIPEAVYTGYLASFEKIFEASDTPESPVLLPAAENLQFTAAGDDSSKLDITLIHTPKTCEEETDGGTVTKAVTGSDGRQVYEHRAEIDVNGGEKQVSLEAGEKTEFKDSRDTSFKVGLDGDGRLKVSAYGYPGSSLTDEQEPKASADGIPLEVNFTKNVTHARADRSADAVQIKINSEDNVNAGDIYNDREKPQDTPDVPYTPYTPEKKKGSLEIMKADAKTGEALAGAKFRIWSGNDSFGERYEVSDEQGRVLIGELEAGRYYICEIEAPEGYILDDTVYEAEVAAGEKTEVGIDNSRMPEDDIPAVPDMPESPDVPEYDTPAEKVPQTGDTTGMMMYLAVMLAALLAGAMILLRRFVIKAGKITITASDRNRSL